MADKLQVTGRVYRVSETIKPNPEKKFVRRDIIIDKSRFVVKDQYTGETAKYENFPKFEFNNNHASLLDGINVGDVVTISFDVTGRFYTDKQGIERHMGVCEGYEIEVVERAGDKNNYIAQNAQQNAMPTPQPQMVVQMAQTPLAQPAPQPQTPQRTYQIDQTSGNVYYIENGQSFWADPNDPNAIALKNQNAAPSPSGEKLPF